MDWSGSSTIELHTATWSQSWAWQWWWDGSSPSAIRLGLLDPIGWKLGQWRMALTRESQEWKSFVVHTHKHPFIQTQKVVQVTITSNFAYASPLLRETRSRFDWIIINISVDKQRTIVKQCRRALLRWWNSSFFIRPSVSNWEIVRAGLKDIAYNFIEFITLQIVSCTLIYR